MSNAKIEGTIVLEGLLQGRLPDEATLEPALREWVGFVRKLGVRFNLEIANGGFSLLPDAEPVPAASVGDPPEKALEQALEQLQALFRGNSSAQLFSTLRSREYRHNEEVRTVYAVTAGGVKAQTGIVDAETIPPPEPLSWKARLQMAGFGLAFAAVLIGIALLFPGTRQLLSAFFENVRPVDAKEIQVDAAPYAAYFGCTVDEEQSGRGGVVLLLKRTEAFPKNDAELTAAVASAGDNVRQRLAVESLARGFIRVELMDPDGKLLAHVEPRVIELRTKETQKMTLPVPSGVRLARIVFVP